ncbi:transcriptional activator xlnR [Xylogone sp. PMI_703]|nr:transcriptional activator xlnR [Xylogone sp. PMI_703]
MSLQLLATVAEESVNNIHTSAHSSDHTQQPGVTAGLHAPGRRKHRIKRACDKCSLSRIRCNGECPCNRCRDYGHICSYAREIKRRGRRTKPRTTQAEDVSARAEEVLDTTVPCPERSSNSSENISTLELNSFHYDADDADNAAVSLPSGRGATPSWQQYHGQVGNSPLTFSEHLPPPSGLLSSDLPSRLSLHHNPSIVAHQLSDPVSIHHRCHVENDGIVAESPRAHSIFSIDITRPTLSPHASDTIHPVGQTSVAPSTSLSSPLVVNSVRADISNAESCCYPVLTPVPPILTDIMPIRVACELLQIYFHQPGSSVLKCASPYVLTHVLRRRAVLHPFNPRQTGPALLLAMLLATAHTADIDHFHVPGSRTVICDKLYAAVVKNMCDPDDWHRLLNGVWIMLGAHEHNNIADEGGGRKEKGEGKTVGPNAGTDELLAIILVTIVVSGGTFKADCLRWWSKALRLARVLKLIRLDDKNNGSHSQSFLDAEAAEEKRRVFWLLFCLDRHLALSYNAPLAILDADISVYLPLPETLWEYVDLQPLPITYRRIYGPKTTISGIGFFEFFLPLMTILGDIILLHHRRLHPRFGALNDAAETAVVKKLLDNCEQSLKQLQDAGKEQTMTAEVPVSLPATGGSDSSSDDRSTIARVRLVTAYSTHILHVLAVLLYGIWDPLTMLTASSASSNSTTSAAEDSDDWMTPTRFMKCASHAVSASQAVATIIMLDPELVFMPYLFGIYLLHGSFILLLFADRMPQLGGPNTEVEQACETIIRAHEVCVVTLSTEFQRSFRRILRSTLYSVSNVAPTDLEESRARRNALGMYRWARGGRGLAL